MTISLATGTGLTGTLTVDAVAGVATFSSLMIADDGTYNLDAASPGLTSAAGLNESTSIYIVGAAASLYIVPGQGPPSSVEAGSTWGFIVGADDAFGNPTPDFLGERDGRHGYEPGWLEPERRIRDRAGRDRAGRGKLRDLQRVDAEQGEPGCWHGLHA